jgi:hypothetical protein
VRDLLFLRGAAAKPLHLTIGQEKSHESGAIHPIEPVALFAKIVASTCAKRLLAACSPSGFEIETFDELASVLGAVVALHAGVFPFDG